ncbi:14026_t:CDS:2, partial [Cetraspora pellucida]
QNAQKHAAADALADASISRIMIEDFFRILKTMKGQTIENFKQIVDISGYTTPINSKELAMYISNNIFTAVNFKFNYKDSPPRKSNHLTIFRYHCAQLLDQQKKSKKHEDHTKHRDRLPMQQFHCGGWLLLTIDTEKMQITIELSHKYHVEYVDVRVMNEIKEYVQANLQQTPRNIWENLNENQIQSAIKIIKQYDDIELLLTVEESGITMISFGVKKIISQLGVNAVDIGVDATYNTNKMNLELYSVFAEVDGMGFPLAYMLLTTATAMVDGVRTRMIAHFFDNLRHMGINPTFVMTDKDSAQISAAELIQSRIQPQSKKIAFNFCPPEHHNHILNLVTKHFNQHPYIPADDMQYYSSNQIRETADLKSNNKARTIAAWCLAFKRDWKACSKKVLSDNSYATNPIMWTCSCLAYLDSHFLLCKHLVQSVCPLRPNFFNEVKRYRSPPFWRHKNLIPLVQGLEPVKEDEFDETYELEDDVNTNISVDNEQFNNETNKNLVEQLNNATDDELEEALQEYEESESYDDFFEKVNES